MKSNVKITKVMKITKNEIGLKIMIYGQVVEQVNKFKYLEAAITKDGRCDAEIRTRIAMTKDVFSKRKDFLTREISIVVRRGLDLLGSVV